MTCTELQKSQIERLISLAFHELQFRAGRNQSKAAVELAYACHNLPQAHRNEHFEFSYFQNLFRDYHISHGYLIYDFASMMGVIKDNKEFDISVMYRSD